MSKPNVDEKPAASPRATGNELDKKAAELRGLQTQLAEVLEDIEWRKVDLQGEEATLESLKKVFVNQVNLAKKLGAQIEALEKELGIPSVEEEEKPAGDTT